MQSAAIPKVCARDQTEWARERRSVIETEQRDVAVGEHVFLALEAVFPGIARGGDGGGEGEAIAVRQHVTFILMAIAGNFDSSVTAEGSLAALGMPLFIELAHGASLDKAVISRSAR